ncbi:putative glucose-methanol-choline oxidoreductase [Durotheca rogersii]|uniref:putative glucose-methanol-choline oxidoreductase n=1 Tax=Durotheca rogersii TaxID=419775 RepID=UPI0022207567|nr:putative glucose-methanol-choline oxidoreductase [Durotheca rogersii]KAI5860471.1 putative glucose-methanol-choline oxidoreductase [Durotheca rogersii]
MVLKSKIASLALVLAPSVCGKAIPRLQARRLLGSSFGIPGDNATFDYVVVGGGTAGLTLATRLVEQKAGSVAVIEAGTFYEISTSNTSQVPALDGLFASRGEHDWQPLNDWGYVTTPQVGGYNESIHYARGRMLGGSSARNYMAYHRGTAGSYRLWAEAVGDDSYTFDNFLPYFEKSVNFTGPSEARFANATPRYDPSTLGDETTGPLSVTYSRYAQAFATWATEGLRAIGFPTIDGFQSGRLLGQSYCLFTINADTMVRDSSETSFLRQALKYPEYMVYPLTMAKRIVFEGKRATGVVVNTQGAEYILSARNEVILSAGFVGSPQLLLVSGVGPADALRELDIPVVADRPGVGQGMQDHVYFGITYRVNAPTLSALEDPAFAAQQAKLFEDSGDGMYANPTTDVLAWEKVPEPHRSRMQNSSVATLDRYYPADWPEVEYLTLSNYIGAQTDSRRGAPRDGYNYATLAVSIVAPRSRGTISIASADTAVPPNINPNFLADRTDADVAVAGFKRAREFWRSDTMRPFRVGGEYFPGANVTTDAQIENVIRRSYNTIYHGACTCAMGRAGDRHAVVDTKARVFGVEGLRVVDAAAFPLLPPGHPQATVYALAEKIACDISGNC